MVFGSVISSPRGNLSLQQVIHLANVYLENASKSTDPDIRLVLCHDAEISLSQAKKAAKYTEDKAMREGIASVYDGLGELLEHDGHGNEAQAFYKKSEKLGGHVRESGKLTRSSRPSSIVHSIKSAFHSIGPIDKPTAPPSSQSPHKQPLSTATLPKDIFPENVRLPSIAFTAPEPDSRLNDTRQLACCLGLLQPSIEMAEILDPAARTWLEVTQGELDEKERLEALATDVIRAFKRDEFKDAKAVIEVVYLAPVLEKDDFRYLLKEFYSGVDQSGLLDVHQLEGLAHLIQGAKAGYLDSDDLVKVLNLLSTRLRDTHQQSTDHLYQLTVAVSHVLDAMADASVSGLNREKVHEPLSLYLAELKESSDAYLVYRAAYAYQALMCVPDDETLWQATLRRSGKVIQGVSGLVSAVKGLDLNGFIEGLGKIQDGLAGATEMIQAAISAYDRAMSLSKSGQGFFECLKEGFSFDRKCAWYAALRGADTLIQDGQFAEFRTLVCEAPCLRDPAFQWGVCERLGQVAASSVWDSVTRQSAISFLVEIYQNDAVWGHHTTVKQWIVNILMQLSSFPGGEIQFVETQLQSLQKDGDAKKQILYKTCRENGLGSHPLKVGLPEIGSPSLLDRVQARPDVEGSLRQLRRQRLKERGKAVYIRPQAKVSLKAPDESGFPLMEKVEEFLASDQMVFLLLGDSGAGKSTFNRELECHLWRAYKKGGLIPLHINLPAIEKPEHDMIAKQLRKAEFTEPQIRELKLHRKFTLICDGYDESQQTHNLYTSNHLNQAGEWNAKMVVSCRSEYLGVDYRDRFQPGDRNNRSDSDMFQEAVITQFSLDQVQDYITQYVSVHRPLWEADEYRKALDLIPSLKELVKNPFLMSLSLEVLPRMVDPGQDFSTTHITRTALYDQFIEHWFERGKKRLGEMNMSPQVRSAFESLIDEGFTRNGMAYLKRLCAAIYKEQDGQPVVTYSRYKDESSWKAEFFSREEEKQIFREACPLIRNGNQHRFIHRSLLEYGVALAMFDPQDWKEMQESRPTLARRGSVSSLMSSDEYGTVGNGPVTVGQEPDLKSPLAWRRFVKEPSVMQFLKERVQQEPFFKQQLLGYIEHSKEDKKWRIAAANAITILVQAGVQFNHADLRGIRIPNADLSYGMFDSAQLQGADLRQVDLSGAWLRRANLDNTRMAGARFGELPSLKHDSGVEMCVYSPDGETISAGLYNGKVIMYSTSNWEILWTLEGHSGKVTSMVYSPNGNKIASGSSDHTVRLWDVRTGMCIHTLNGHDAEVRSIAYSPQGDRIASSSNDMTIKMWDVESGECRYIWIGHTDMVSGVIYSPKGIEVASRSDDNTVRIWDVETGNCLHVLKGHHYQIRGIAYSPQGHQLASGDIVSKIRLWITATGECRRILYQQRSRVLHVVYSPNGNQLASAGHAEVWLWDVDRGMCLHVLQGHSSWVRSVVYSPQSDLVASYSDDRTVRLWDAATGACQQTLTGHSKEITSVMFSPKENRVASSSYDTTVRLWDIGVGASRHSSSGHNTEVKGVKCSPRGDNVATYDDNDETVRIWDVEAGVCRHVLRGHSNSVKCVGYSPQGDQIATGSYDYTVRLWNIESGACTHILKGHTFWINAVAYSPHGEQLASGSDDNTVRLWDVKSGECRHTLIGHTGVVRDVVYSPNGNQLFSCGYDSTVRVWDVETGTCSHILIGSGGLYHVAYSPQSDTIASISYDTVRVWNVETGECRYTFLDHDIVAFSPRGDQIASSGDDGSVKVWDTESGDCLWIFIGHRDRVNKIVYSPQGDLVASANDDRSVRLWNVTSGQCRAVIQDFQDGVTRIDWSEVSGVNYLVAGCRDGVVGAWKVQIDEDRCDVSLKWMTARGVLDVNDTTIQDVQGLSHQNRQLLKQRGAVEDPINRLREVGKNVTTMASVVSKLKASSTATAEDPALGSGGSFEQLGQLLEQAKDPLIRDMVAVIVKNINGRE
ncbi:MAG: WD40-repeat-containing domain protein [Benniella sp.]|nr:MAG: WD40-repeat-containing domain protein [Benniella sp.]